MTLNNSESSYTRDMSAGFIDIFPLIRFAEQNGVKDAFKPRGEIPRAYHEEVPALTNSVPADQGFYVWGKFSQEAKEGWIPLYLGKAGLRKITSLRYRITDELREEKPFAWATCSCYTPDAVRQAYMKHWTYKDKVKTQRSLNHVNRSLRKTGTEFIAWIACPALGEKQIRLVEHLLIKGLDPTGNVQRCHRPKNSGQQNIDIQPLIEKIQSVIEQNLPNQL